MTDTPPRRAGLRDEIAHAIHRYDHDHLLSGNDIPSKHHRGEADAVLALLHREWPWLQAEAEETEAAATEATDADAWKQQKDAQCEDCLAGAHGPNTHRKQSPPLEPQIIPAGLPPWIRNSLHDLNVREQPAEHCGHQSPVTLLTAQPTECVLQPGHQGSHADDRGCRWWPTPEAVDWRQRAETAKAALERVLHVADLIEAGAPWTANRADTARRIRDAMES